MSSNLIIISKAIKKVYVFLLYCLLRTKVLLHLTIKLHNLVFPGVQLNSSDHKFIYEPILNIYMNASIIKAHIKKMFGNKKHGIESGSTRQVSEPPRMDPDPTEKVTDPQGRDPDQIRKVQNRTEKVTDPPGRYLYPPGREPDPTEKVTDPPGRYPNPPRMDQIRQRRLHIHQAGIWIHQGENQIQQRRLQIYQVETRINQGSGRI